MKCVLMNKNIEVLSAEYDSATGVFTDIYDVYNIEYSPYILNKIYEFTTNIIWKIALPNIIINIYTRFHRTHTINIITRIIK